MEITSHPFGTKMNNKKDANVYCQTQSASRAMKSVAVLICHIEELTVLKGCFKTILLTEGTNSTNVQECIDSSTRCSYHLFVRLKELQDYYYISKRKQL